MEISKTLRRRFLRDLQERCRVLFGEWAYDKVYKHGVWSGILNALDENSPHAIKTNKEGALWHRIGVEYLGELVSKAEG